MNMIIICFIPTHYESRDPEQYKRVRFVTKTPISNSEKTMKTFLEGTKNWWFYPTT